MQRFSASPAHKFPAVSVQQFSAGSGHQFPVGSVQKSSAGSGDQFPVVSVYSCLTGPTGCGTQSPLRGLVGLHSGSNIDLQFPARPDQAFGG